MVEATPGEMLSTLSHRGPDGNGVWLEKSAGVGLGQCLRVTTPEALHERQPLVSREGRIVLVADARVDNRTDLIRALDLRGDPDKIPDSALILAAYERWGEDCADRIVGDFAFAIWDGNERKWFCARDPFGCRSVHYTHRPGQLFACATEIKALLAVAEIPRELEEMRVGLFLTGTFDDEAITFYKGIFRLPAGHCMVVDESGLRVRRYFELDPKRDIRFRTDDAYAEAFLEIFTEAVRCRLRATAPVLSTLSGGLDSTSIACVARDLLKKSNGPELMTLSAIFPSFTGKDKKRIDERSFVADVTAAGGIKPFYVEADRVSPLVDLDRILELQDEAVLTPNYYLHWALYQAAKKQNAGVFLDGIDGDTTVSHGFDYLTDLARGLRPFRLLKEARALARVTSSRHGTRSLIMDLAVRPLMDSLSYPWRKMFKRRGAPWGALSLVNPEFAAEIGLADRIRELRGDPPRPVIGSRACHRSGLLSPLIPHALEVADRGTNFHGLEARYPFCDRRLAEFCLALPGTQKLRLGMSRYVMSRAMEGILPTSVQWRNSKADLSPSLFHGLWRYESERVRAAAETRSEAAHRFVDIQGFRQSVQTYSEGGNAEAFRLYGILSLLRWLELSGMG
jgi:asparagine synthase (glutamine-hydrolysing)